MDPQLFAEFKVRLAQTIYWCERRSKLSSPASSLRTMELRPSLLEKNRVSAVEFVVNTRELHGLPEIREATIPDRLAGGQLLVYFPDDDLACGAAEYETDGFFDVNNVPPWDTWVTYIENAYNGEYDTEYLVAWIPREFVELANRGVYVNPEQCIQWLAHTRLELAAVLRDSGFFNQAY